MKQLLAFFVGRLPCPAARGCDFLVSAISALIPPLLEPHPPSLLTAGGEAPPAPPP